MNLSILSYSCSKVIYAAFCLAILGGCTAHPQADTVELADGTITPEQIKLDLPSEYERPGGIIAADVNSDGERDFIITKSGQIAVYAASGEQLWKQSVNIQVTQKAENNGLPGLHGAGVQVADVDGDEQAEILFLTKSKTLEIVQGDSGATKHSITIPSPQGTERWEHLVIANFRGLGDQDLLLQTTNKEGYRMGKYLAAYSLEELIEADNPQPLWKRDDFVANAHNGARIADLDGDGKDEVLGGTIIAADGEMLFSIPLKGHVDSIFSADVRPDLPGLEVVALEEGGRGGNRIFLYNQEGLIWSTDYKHQEPQNAVIGDFDPQRPGLEIWCRSRYSENQKPFIFDAQGKLIDKYEMSKVAPPDWTVKGVEVIFAIDWTGEPQQLAVAKERHESGDIGIFAPVSGQFLYRFPEQADRLYVADVSGDWREEIIVLRGNQLNIYSNSAPNPQPDHPRLWTQEHYRRSKMTWNYYSP